MVTKEELHTTKYVCKGEGLSSMLVYRWDNKKTARLSIKTLEIPGSVNMSPEQLRALAGVLNEAADAIEGGK